MDRIDLHIHSNYSDGKFSPKEIIDMAKQNNVKYISITDHDNIGGYSNELFDYANKNNITLIPGVEISTKTDKCGIHVLGYNFDLDNKELVNQLCKLRNARHDYLHKMSNKLYELGYIVNINKLDKIDSITKGHIANDVVNNKSNEKQLIKYFGHLPNKGEFIETIMNEGCPAYIKKESITPKEASRLIKNAGGKVVLAHPVAYTYEDNLTNDDIEKIVKDMNPDGLEANYIYFRKCENRKINEIDKWKQFAKDHKLFETIGSDFHDFNNLFPEIGLINEKIIYNETFVNNIIDNLINKKS